ncbi:DinB family protein [Citricoccus nitrophenolicus]|uniref:DinB family protein n=1 Tax=Citricoccus nitrophenolicus TaxID=863575 RepID=UPI0031F06508
MAHGDDLSTGPDGDSTASLPELAQQVRWHWEHHLSPRLQGMSDEEYHWESARGAWGLRPRGVAGPEDPGAVRAGGGDWLVDFAFPEPNPAPVTTIAWRAAHVLVGVLGARMAGHFGGPAMDYYTYDYPGTADEAYARLGTAVGRWCDAVDTLGPAELGEPVGEAEGPWAEHPMLELVLHVNREVIHHGAEMCLLRDLYRAERT